MNRYDGIDKRIVSNVKRQAKILKRNKVFRYMEIEDIEQKLMCEILACIDKFDERCGDFEHFIREVLKRRSLNLIEEITRKKRDSVINFSEYNDEIKSDLTDDVFNKHQTMVQQRIDIAGVVDKLPMTYRLSYRLLSNHNIADTAKIIGVSHTMVQQYLKRISIEFRYLEDPEKRVLFIKKGEKRMSKNLSAIEVMDAKELSQLEIRDLADLSDQAAKLISHTKDLKAKLKDALNLRFSETIKESLRSENKDTGTVRFAENGFQIIAEVPKKITWDADQMEEIIKTIPEDKRKSIVKTSYTIDERKYAQLPYEYQQLFLPARTVTPGKTRLQITLPEEN